MNTILTVCGPVEAASMGHFQMHEHLFVRATPASEKNPALCIDDEARSIAELQAYRAAGGSSILDAQPVGAGRDLAALKRISSASGVNTVSVTGYHLPAFYPPEHSIHTAAEGELADQFTRELLEGVDCEGERIFPGAVKAALSAGGAAGQLGVCLRAAATAAAKAKVPLIMHTEKGVGALEAVKMCIERGMAPERIAVCHVDRQVDDFTPHDEIAATGVFMEYDTIARYRYHDDESEVRLILHMLEQGHGDRLLFSLDTTAARLRSYGDPAAPGLDFILKTFLPMLESAGVNRQTLRNITVNNPAYIFGI